MRRAKQQTITFAAIDSAAAPARKSGLTLLSSDVKLSKDGAAYASATNAPAEIGSTGRYSLVLAAAEADCSWLHVYVEKTGMQPVDIIGAMSEQPSGAVVADAGNVATAFMTGLASTVDNFWKDAIVVFTTGALADQSKRVASYSGTTKVLTLVAALTAAPSAGDKFLLLNI